MFGAFYFGQPYFAEAAYLFVTVGAYILLADEAVYQVVLTDA